MFRLDQKGVSLPLVLAILGLVIANTYYFMDVEKSTKEQNIKRSSELEDNSEKLRLASFLSDVKVCSSDNLPAVLPLGSGNSGFGGRTIAQINDTVAPQGSAFPLKKAGIDFLRPTTYARGSLQFVKYQIVVTNPAAPNPDISKRYSLHVTYSLVDRLTKVASPTKTKVIRFPLYIIFEAGNPNGKITTCYTEADESLGTVTSTVQNACLGGTAIEGTNLTNGLIECQHNIVSLACANSEVLIGVKVNALDKEEFVCGHPENKATTALNCPQTPMREFISDLKVNDEFVCRTTDTGCADGQMYVMGPAQSPVCVSYCNPNELFEGVGSNGIPRCIQRTEPCGPGTYAKKISAGGKVTCAPYIFLNKTCSLGRVATDVNMAAGTAANGDTIFNCKPITKSKDCTEPTTATTYVTSLAPVTPSCATF